MEEKNLRKRIIMPIFAAFVTLAVFGWFSGVFKNNSQANSQQANLTNVLHLDSDGDGIEDKLELLYLTNPHNVDSDGDGISDYDELRLGTNPSEIEPDTHEIDSDNLTEYYGELIVGALLAGDLSDFSVGELGYQVNLDYLANNLQQSVIELRPDIPVTYLASDNSNNAKKAYLESITRILAKLPEQAPYFETAAQYLINEENYKTVFLADVAKLIEEMMSEIGALQTPADYREWHERKLTMLRDLSFSYSKIADVNNDPVMAMIAVQDITEVLMELEKTSIELRQELLAQNLDLQVNDLF